MRRAIFHTFFYMLLLVTLTTILYLTLTPPSTSYALTGSAKKPALTLNRTQGPLGVTLTLRGKNFPPGPANLSFIDSDNVPGMFAPPSDTSVVVLPSGAFLTTNLMLPTSGPIGAWKIIVTDSQGTLNTIRYSVLAAPRQKTAGAPSLTLTLPGGASNATPTASVTAAPSETTSATPTTTPTGTASATPTTTPTTNSSSSIIFTGSNWLPKGTAVKLILSTQGTSLPLLEPAPVSNSDGVISGSFNMPTNLTYSSATIIATDTASGALRVQVPIAINNGVVSFSASATPQPSTGSTPSTSTASTPVASSSGADSNPLVNMNAAIWGPVLLVVGGMLAIAGIMLILFMLPWSHNNNHGGSHTRNGQY